MAPDPSPVRGRRSAIVTGGAGGLGAPTVDRLLADGYAVVAFDRRHPEGAAGCPGLRRVEGDVTDDDAVEAAVDAAVELGELRVLVNVAGGSAPGTPTVGADGEPHDRRTFERTLTSNAVGTFNACRLVAAAMAEQPAEDDGQRGVIVNTASVAGVEGQRGQLAYAAAKAAILGMTLPMARDLASVGIRVCAIAPGPMGTPAMLRLRDQLLEDPAADVVNPARMGRPEEFAALVAHIVANPYLNGEHIRLDGALRLGAGTDPSRSVPQERRSGVGPAGQDEPDRE